MEYYSVIERNELLNYKKKKKRRKFKCILLNERSQSENATCHTILNILEMKTDRDREKFSGCQGLG